MEQLPERRRWAATSLADTRQDRLLISELDKHSGREQIGHGGLLSYLINGSAFPAHAEKQ